MARRRELSNIASGIAGSFNSRNNDVDGYWGIGKLYKFVEIRSEKKIELDLLNKTMSPDTNQFDSLLLQYHIKLLALLKTQKIPTSWVSSAKVSVVFETELPPKNRLWRSALGKPCEVSCRITDDNGRQYAVSAYNHCQPHNPQKEINSGRANDF